MLELIRESAVLGIVGSVGATTAIFVYRLLTGGV